MRLITFTKRVSFLAVFLAFTNFLVAQVWQQQGGPPFWGNLDPGIPISAAAVYNNTNQPSSALHVNTNLVANPFYGAGEVFRTDAPIGLSSPVTA